jgi:hypothetical protein
MTLFVRRLIVTLREINQNLEIGMAHVLGAPDHRRGCGNGFVASSVAILRGA